jgi:hypothetical protein
VGGISKGNTNSSVRKKFLQDLASDEKKIKQLFVAGLTEIDINNLKKLIGSRWI